MGCGSGVIKLNAEQIIEHITYYRKGLIVISEIYYLFQYCALLVLRVCIFVNILLNISINWCYVENFVLFRQEIAKIWTIEIFSYTWGHLIPLKSVHVQKIYRNLQNFCNDIELFHSLKHLRRSSFILTSILLQCY